MADREFRQELVEHRLARIRFGLGHFEHGADVLLDGQAAEDRGFLRQIADAEPGAAVHRQIGDVLAVELDGAGVGGDQAGDDVEAGRLAGAVGPEQPHHLAALDRNADIAQHRPALEAFAQAVTDQTAIIGDQTRRSAKPGRPCIARSVASDRRRAHQGFLPVAEEPFPLGVPLSAPAPWPGPRG